MVTYSWYYVSEIMLILTPSVSVSNLSPFCWWHNIWTILYQLWIIYLCPLGWDSGWLLVVFSLREFFVVCPGSCQNVTWDFIILYTFIGIMTWLIWVNVIVVVMCSCSAPSDHSVILVEIIYPPMKIWLSSSCLCLKRMKLYFRLD